MTDAEFVTISSGDLTARINPLGAELWSLTDAIGQEYMTDADPAFWTGHAPVLFPVVGALNHDRYRLGDRHYELKKHGFARHSAFSVISAEADEVRLRLTDSAQTRALYPFAFALELAFRVDGMRLGMMATVTNADEVVMPFSLGFHPAFAWPLPGGGAKEDHRVVFVEAEAEPIRRVDPTTGLLLPDRMPSPVDGHILVPDADLFKADALIWDAVCSRALTFGANGGAQLALAFPDTPMLGIWQKPGAHYLCVEPWQGHADPVGYDGDLHDKPGIVLLEPGASRSFHMDVTVLPAN